MTYHQHKGQLLSKIMKFFAGRVADECKQYIPTIALSLLSLVAWLSVLVGHHQNPSPKLIKLLVPLEAIGLSKRISRHQIPQEKVLVKK